MLDTERNEQEQHRLEKLTLLRNAGVNPYPVAYEQTHHAAEISENFSDSDADKFSSVALAGRIMAIRRMGKATFCHIQDATGKIQVYLKKDDLNEWYDHQQHFDIGDIIGVSGFVFRTRMGEITIHATSLMLLAKSITPIPVVKEETDDDGNLIRHDAFADKEQRYRKRYLDLIVNPHIKQTFVLRSRIISEMRRFFDSRGWLEVETPILQPLYGGATARPFVTHHNALDVELYLRIADELYLKRLIVGGFEAVYEISKNFRNEGMDKTHNPEFSSMEIYVAYKDYLWIMDMTEELINSIVNTLFANDSVVFQDTSISFARPFARKTMSELFVEFTGEEIIGRNRDELVTVAKALKVDIDLSWNAMKLLDEIFSVKVQPNLIQPTFVIDYPVEMSPLAKKHRSKPGLVERFELFVNGKEIANAFTELNDPLDQRARLEEQSRIRAEGDEEAMVVDEDFLHALEVGLPPTAGLGIGIDRLVMLLTNNDSIRDVMFFPQMRPERE